MTIKKFFKKHIASISFTAGIAVIASAAASPVSASAMTPEDKFLSFACSCEFTTSPNPVQEYYGIPDLPWCHAFTVYCAKVTGLELAFADSTFCADSGEYIGGETIYKQWGCWHSSVASGGIYYRPKRGDQIYFDMDPNDGKWEPTHTGIIYYVSEDGTLFVCEGNSGPYPGRVALTQYHETDPRIYGYGTPRYYLYYDNFDEEETAPGYTITTTQTTAFDNSSSSTTTTAAPENNVSGNGIKYIVSGSDGAYLRADSCFGNNTIGIMSTDTVVTVDEISFPWLHIVSAPVEGLGGQYSGWAYYSNLTALEGTNAPETAAPEVTVPAPTPSPSYNTTPSYTPTPEPSYSGYTAGYYIGSPIGSWGHYYPSFDPASRSFIINTGEYVEVLSVTQDYGWAYVRTQYGEYTYVHTSNLTTEPVSEPGTSPNETYPQYIVTSPEGCNFRPNASFDGVIAILDTYTVCEVITTVNGTWAYARVCLDGYSYTYGYINLSCIAPC